MTYRLELYKCNVCGNLIEVLIPGVGELVCCGEPMEQLQPKTQDSEYGEKHVPVFVQTEDNKKEIHVGSELHPMQQEHYIQFIESVSEDNKCLHIKFLEPGEQPIMEIKEENIKFAREMCNIHGLWAGQKE